jgi:hypothetical protein
MSGEKEKEEGKRPNRSCRCDAISGSFRFIFPTENDPFAS